MNIHFPIFNIIKNSQKLLDNKSIDILYSRHNSVFDLCFREIDKICIKNIDSDSYLNDYLDYHIYITNTPLEYIDKIKTIKEYHLIDCIFAHEPLPLSLKKEDKYLILEQLRSTPIVSMNNRTTEYFNTSPHTKVYNIQYGIPKSELNSKETRKPLVVLNIDNDDQTNRLFSYIKTHISEAEIISDPIKYPTIQNILSELNNFKVIVDTKSDINILCGLLSGCIAITSNGISYADSIQVNRPEDILSMAKNFIENYNIEDRLPIIEKLAQQHDYHTFTEQLIELIQQKLWRPYV